MVSKSEVLERGKQFIDRCDAFAVDTESIRRQVDVILAQCESDVITPGQAWSQLLHLDNASRNEYFGGVQERRTENAAACQDWIGRRCIANRRLGRIYNITQDGRVCVEFLDGKKPAKLTTFHPTSIKLIEEDEEEV